ncbi:unnamed protein product [Schistocephalus solidus]|uniref:Uncharacterized protein n=1 Tax=Schistocephalus solidus TaxID=70667 RepID=A0A183S9X2_SCHSO|nr:unnamed protein product [Schistocephalus solidus]
MRRSAASEALEVCFLKRSELPPAYKDVVPLVAVPSLPSSTFPHYPPSVNDVIRDDAGGRAGDGESGSASGGEMLECGGGGGSGERTPPPSYQEVIALSPTAADMRNRVLAAQHHPRTAPADGCAVATHVHRSDPENATGANGAPQV